MADLWASEGSQLALVTKMGAYDTSIVNYSLE